MGTPASAADDVNSSPMAALSAAMAPSSDPALPKDTLDEPSPFAAPPLATTTSTADLPAIAPRPGTSDFDDLRPRGGIRDLIATVTSSRRNLAIVGGGLGVILLASALVFCGGSKPKAADKPTQTAKATAPEPAPEPAKPEPTEPAPTEPTPTEPTPTEAGSGANLGPTPEELAAANDPAPTETPTEPAEPTETKRPTPTKTKTTPTQKTGKTTTPAKTVATKTTPEPRPTPNVGGKQVVAETDAQARAGKSIAGVDQSALQKARGAYLSGNKRLSSGDGATAAKHFRQALGYYPGYLAAYRGLGAAYEKQGDKANAVKAYRTYLGGAPGAPDAGAIKARVAALQ